MSAPLPNFTLPISFTLIVRNCGAAAVSALKSLKAILLHPDDEVVCVDNGSTDDTVGVIMRESGLGKRLRLIERPDLTDPDMVAQMRKRLPKEFAKFGDHPQFKGGCLSDFAAARQVSLDAAKNPIVSWIDADDVLEGDLPMLRAEVEDFFAKKNGECMFLKYEYAHDEDGACTTALWRERFCLRTRHKWVGRCHEVMIPIDGFKGGIARSETGWIRHVHGLRKQHEFSDLRNYVILKKQLEEAPDLDNCDPRTLYYLGNACRGLSLWREAEWCYRKFLPRSGSRDDRVLTCLHLGQMYCMAGRPWKAIRSYQEGGLIHPGDPRVDFGLQRCFFDLGRWQQSIEAGEAGLEKVAKFGTLNSYDPQQLSSFPWYFIACSKRELLDVDGAWAATQRFLETRGGLEAAKDFARHMRAWYESAKASAAIKQVAGVATSRPNQIEILRSIQIPPMGALFGVCRPEDDINRNGRETVSIYCGETAEAWGHDGDKMGIGGSERMVLEMAKRLQARGLAVTVYCKLGSPQQRGTHDGVEWRHHLEFNPLIARDYLVVWRNPAGLQIPVPAKKRYLWLHDITGDAAFPPITQAVLDKAIFVSPWARSLVTALPESKVYVSANGIDVAAIKALAGTPRDPHKIVYASSPDRGLHLLLKAWPEIIQANPLASLEILYGFTPYYLKVAAKHEYVSIGGVQRHRLDYMEDVFETCDHLPRVQMRGRVGKDEVLRTLLGAGALCYPSSFDETFCIAAAEAQACGCAVIAPRKAALATTLNEDPLAAPLAPVTVASVTAAVNLYLLNDFEAIEGGRKYLAGWAQERFGLDKLADEWVRDLFGGADE